MAPVSSASELAGGYVEGVVSREASGDVSQGRVAGMTQPALDFIGPEPPKSFVDRVADYFKAYPGKWLDGRELATIGGGYAWRSRVSDCRTQLGMTIENRQRRVTVNGSRYVISEYRFVPLDK
ncbi:MAG TPA: hypothetical protein VNH84_02315 [Candidatus Saccharimonadales bacterium]|nr:hypothetical protein [Candidatus Saccharimonadales bacterium]